MRNESAIAKNECTIFFNESATAINESVRKYKNFVPDSFFVMADSYLCHGALVENDESAKRINEPSRRRHESTIKINESVGKNVGNEEIVWRIHFRHWRIHFGSWQIQEKFMNTPRLVMNKDKKVHFWRRFEMSKRGNLPFFLIKVADS